MARIPVRFKRVAAAFDEVARVRLCESSGSEHSPERSTDLSDLVKSFMEKDHHGGVGGMEEEILDGDERGCEGGYWCDSMRREMLKGLFECEDEDGDRSRIQRETEVACRLLGDKFSHGFKRRLMAHLRDRGFDAGLCKSRWEKSVRFPAGTYEYVDINVGATRYIIEVNLAGEFEIARPTDGYLSLLGVFPPIFVGKPDELKKIVRQTCAAVKESMKSVDMHMPPWRRNGYMQAKWFATYKRTTNLVATTKATKSKLDEGSSTKKRSIGFVASQVRPYNCRGDGFTNRIGLKIGQLTAAISGAEEVGV